MLLGARSETPGAEVDAQTRRASLMKILNRIESKLEGDKPLIIVGEDVHWADQDSQELFAALLKVDTPRPIFGLMAGRLLLRVPEQLLRRCTRHSQLMLPNRAAFADSGDAVLPGQHAGPFQRLQRLGYGTAGAF